MNNSTVTSTNLRRNAKDDVFCDMFTRKEYLLELYRDLHPEDTEAVESDLEIVTIDRVVTSGPYNDLGFVARNRLVVLVEAQSTWSPNIATRLLFYLVETYREILQERPGALHSSTLVALPAPELYVIHTGTRPVPKTVSFNADVLGNASSEFDFTVHVLTESDGIVGEYVRFARRFDEVASSKEKPSYKAKQLLDSCINEGILEKYLKSRYKEVEDIVFTLFDQEEATRYYESELREKATAEGRAAGRAEGLSEGQIEGRIEGTTQAVRALMAKMSLTAEEAMNLVEVPADIRGKVISLL